MKTTLALVLLVLALSLCNLMGKRGNGNTNENSSPSPGSISETSPTPVDVPPPPPPAAPTATASTRTSNRNTNAAPPVDLRAAPPASAPGAPPSSMPGVNQNSAAHVPRPPTTVSGGVLNGKATSLPKPAYPAIAKAAHVSGAVNVQVTVDENGNVISARAVSGHPLLRASAESAARQAKFSPTKLSGQQVKVTGVIVYNFVAQ